MSIEQAVANRLNTLKARERARKRAELDRQEQEAHAANLQVLAFLQSNMTAPEFENLSAYGTVERNEYIVAHGVTIPYKNPLTHAVDLIHVGLDYACSDGLYISADEHSTDWRTGYRQTLFDFIVDFIIKASGQKVS